MPELIPTIGGREWISVAKDQWGRVYSAHYVSDETVKREQQRLQDKEKYDKLR